jgi:hypothetical protein
MLLLLLLAFKPELSYICPGLWSVLALQHPPAPPAIPAHQPRGWLACHLKAVITVDSTIAVDGDLSPQHLNVSPDSITVQLPVNAE